MENLSVSACVYVLRLENLKFYVGITYHLNIRFAQHTMGLGAKWTKIHRPISIDYVSFTESERDLTLKYMKTYGWENVRGGGWCQVKMDDAPMPLRKNEKATIKRPRGRAPKGHNWNNQLGKWQETTATEEQQKHQRKQTKK